MQNCVELLQWGRTLSSAESGKGKLQSRQRAKPLQWGRTLSSAESTGGSGALTLTQLGFNGAALFQVRKAEMSITRRRATVWLQWGRTLSSAESSSSLRIGVPSSSLQWGRTLSSAESKETGWQARSNRLGFNGAALFQVRKECRPHSRIFRVPNASMGPHSFKCGKLGPFFFSHCNEYCFNGAALFQVRKAGLPAAA